MTASRRDGELTFYDDLGVARDASPEEIRDAFRALVRLLHPDQQTDPQLKETAEKQMRKLNRIYAVVSDVDRRRQYDESLDNDYEPIVPPAPAARPGVKFSGRTAWVLAIVCSAGLLGWLLTQSTPVAQSSAEVPSPPPAPESAIVPVSRPATVVPPDQSSLIASLRSDLKAATSERDSAIRELNPAASRLPASPTPPVRAENPPNRKLAGFWFYARPQQGQHNKNNKLYLPEYIEATITEQNGVLYGKYRSRFEIVDRAISPDVNFTFTGPSSNAAQVSLPWIGAGGAKGELVLKLLSDTSMRFDWKATELGTQQALDSGTAVLIRRVE
jgi:hypothetical protein